jgi:hypothetical protein
MEEMEEMEDDLERVLRADLVIARMALIRRTCTKLGFMEIIELQVNEPRPSDEVGDHQETVNGKENGCECTNFS